MVLCELTLILRSQLEEMASQQGLLVQPLVLMPEVEDSSHMTWLESDSSRKFEDSRLTWLSESELEIL